MRCFDEFELLLFYLNFWRPSKKTHAYAGSEAVCKVVKMNENDKK